MTNEPGAAPKSMRRRPTALREPTAPPVVDLCWLYQLLQNSPASSRVAGFLLCAKAGPLTGGGHAHIYLRDGDLGVYGGRLLLTAELVIQSA